MKLFMINVSLTREEPFSGGSRTVTSSILGYRLNDTAHEAVGDFVLGAFKQKPGFAVTDINFMEVPRDALLKALDEKPEAPRLPSYLFVLKGGEEVMATIVISAEDLDVARKMAWETLNDHGLYPPGSMRLEQVPIETGSRGVIYYRDSNQE